MAKERLEETDSMDEQICSRDNIIQGRFVRNNNQPGTMVNFAYDNCGHNAESKHGFTMHAANDIIIQRTLDTPDESQHLPSPTSRQKKTNSFPICAKLALYMRSKTKNKIQIISDIAQNTENFVFIISQH